MIFTLMFTGDGPTYVLSQTKSGITITANGCQVALRELPDDDNTFGRYELCDYLSTIAKTILQEVENARRTHWHVCAFPLDDTPEAWSELEILHQIFPLQLWGPEYEQPQWKDGTEVDYETAAKINDIPVAEARDISKRWVVRVVQH